MRHYCISASARSPSVDAVSTLGDARYRNQTDVLPFTAPAQYWVADGSHE